MWYFNATSVYPQRCEHSAIGSQESDERETTEQRGHAAPMDLMSARAANKPHAWIQARYWSLSIFCSSLDSVMETRS